MTDLAALATIWRDRPPSGKFVMHQMPRVKHCARCGCMVSKWHRHWTDDKAKGDAVVAKSAWMKA